MGRALKSIGAVVAGFVAASVIMMTVESINGHVLYPDLAKSAQGVTDRDQLRAIFASAPVGALLVVAFGWLLGGLAGGWVSGRIAGSMRPPMVLAVLLTAAGIASNLMLPPPLWFWVATLAVLGPAAYVGGRAGAGRG